MIHSANPQSRPVGIIVFVHVVPPSPCFKSRKNNAADETVGLAEWIIVYNAAAASLITSAHLVMKNFGSFCSKGSTL